MPGLRASIAYGWHELSTLFRCRFHPESRLWNRKVLPGRLGEALYAALPKSRQCPRTSTPDQSALAMRRLHLEFTLSVEVGATTSVCSVEPFSESGRFCCPLNL